MNSEVEFEFTPEEAQTVARRVVEFLKQEGLNVSVESSPWTDAPYTVTLIGTRTKANRKLVEAQGRFDYHNLLAGFAQWLGSKQENAELFVAVSDAAAPPLGTLNSMRKDGVGVISVDDQGSVTVLLQARNFALVVRPAPGLNFGSRRGEVSEMTKKFNEDNDRIGALRQMCEIVERETESVGRLAIRKKIFIKKTEAEFSQLDWSSMINVLSSDKFYGQPADVLVNSKLKDDLHSFRGARNLVDHPPKTKKDKRSRNNQMLERMVMGFRLIDELLAMQGRIKRRK